MWKQVFSIFAIFSSGIDIAYAQEVNAQATEMMIPLDRGGEIVINVEHVKLETQEAIFDHLSRCIVAAEKTRDECVADISVTFAEEHLYGVVRATQESLSDFLTTEDLSLAEVLEDPVFYCEDATNPESCEQSATDITVASLDVELKQVTARRIGAETRVADKKEELEGIETRVAGEIKVFESEVEANEHRQGRNTEIAEDRDANAAVLAALQRVAAENQ